MHAFFPIGIFDSGVGGLTVVKHVLVSLPGVPVLYFGDTAHVPYGGRAPEEIISFGDQIVSFLLGLGAGIIVAACNTSSSISLPVLRRKYNVPFLGVVEPGVRAALRVTRSLRIGVLATAATVQSGAYLRCFRALNPEARVFLQACPLFVPFVEAGMLTGPEVREAARSYLAPLLEAGVDTIILGCTHYPFLMPVLAEIAGPEVFLVDPAEETVRELVGLYAELAGGLPPPSRARHRFFASGPVDSFYTVGRLLLGDCELVVEQVVLAEEAPGLRGTLPGGGRG